MTISENIMYHEIIKKKVIEKEMLYIKPVYIIICFFIYELIFVLPN